MASLHDPCRRFALPLAGHDARPGGDVTRYVFIVEDLHLLLLAGLPAHYRAAKTMTHEYPRHPPARPYKMHTSQIASRYQRLATHYSI